MKINWSALGLVTIASLIATILVVGIFAAGVAAFSAADQRAVVGSPSQGLRALGYLCLAAATAVVLYGIYLIVPAFH